jgi:hypothetical protein
MIAVRGSWSVAAFLAIPFAMAIGWHLYQLLAGAPAFPASVYVAALLAMSAGLSLAVAARDWERGLIPSWRLGVFLLAPIGFVLLAASLIVPEPASRARPLWILGIMLALIGSSLRARYRERALDSN